MPEPIDPTDPFARARAALDEVGPQRDLWGDAQRRAEIAEVHVVTRGSTRAGSGRLLLAAAAAVVVIAGIAVAWPDGDDDRVDSGPVAGEGDEPAEPAPVGPDEAFIAIELATPCEGTALLRVNPEGWDLGPTPWPAVGPRDGPDGVVIHGRIGEQTVEVRIPGEVVTDLVGERVEDIDLGRGPAQIWLRDDAVQLRYFPGGQDRCQSFTVTASGGIGGDQVMVAVDLAESLVLPGDPLAPDGGTDSSTDTTTDTTAPTATTTVPAPYDGREFALWPETDRVELSAEEAPWSADPEETALAFAQAVLGWDDAAATGYETLDEYGDLLITVASPARGASMVAQVSPVVGDRYRVVSFDGRGGDVDERAATVSVQGRTAYASASPGPIGTVSSRARFAYDGVVSEGPVNEEFELSADPAGAGSVMVLFLDADGEVIGGWGTALPAGDFSAS